MSGMAGRPGHWPGRLRSLLAFVAVCAANTAFVAAAGSIPDIICSLQDWLKADSSSECDAVAEELNKLDGIEDVYCDSVYLGAGRPVPVPAWADDAWASPECDAVAEELNKIDGIEDVYCYYEGFLGSDSCSSDAAKLNAILTFTAAGAQEDCPASGGTFDLQQNPPCSCPAGTFVLETGCATRNSPNCQSVGAKRLWEATVPCKCDPGFRGAMCESAAAEKEEAKSFTPFYIASGAVSAAVFGGTLYFSHGSPWLALFATLRVWDTMSDWAMWSITLQNDRFTKYSQHGTDEAAGGDGTFKEIQTASLVFTILGTILLILDLGTLFQRFSSDGGDSGVGLGMCCIVFLEDVPQLVLTVLYLSAVDGFAGLGDGLDSNDALAMASFVLSIISLLMNGVMGCLFLCSSDDK